MATEYTNDEMILFIKARQGKKSLRVFAEEMGLSVGYLSDVYRGNRPVGPKLAEWMGFAQVKVESVTFRKVKR